MSVADEVKARLNIVDYIGRSVPLKKAGQYYKANCPFHGERTPSFVVNESNQSWRCYGACADGGDIFNFAMKQNGWSFAEALAELAKMAGVELNPQTPEQKAKVEAAERLRGLTTALADFYHDNLMKAQTPEAADALRYAREKRGLTDETLTLFGVGFAPPGWQNAVDYLGKLGYHPDDLLLAGVATRKEGNERIYDRFRNRLMIPIRDERGRTIGFGARALDPDDNPKYLNSPQTPLFDKSRVLFGLDVASRTIRATETAVIVEGYMDAIQAHQAGFSNVIAQMGTAMTEAQLKLIAPRWAKRIILALDADAAGQSATMRGLEVARQTLQADYSGKLSVDLRILSIPGAKDPDDLIRETPEVWGELIEASKPVAEYVIDVEVAALSDKPTVQEKEAVVKRLLPLLLASENKTYEHINLQKLGLRLRVSERDLLTWRGEYEATQQAKPPRPLERRVQEDDGPPPAWDDDGLRYDDEDDDGATPPAAAPVVRQAAPVVLRPLPQNARREAYLLERLLEQPDLFYHVNRKLRELAADNLRLAEGPLCDFSADDLNTFNYQTLMRLFIAALDQHQQDLMTFLRENLPEDIVPIFERLFRTEDEKHHDLLRGRQMADLRQEIRQGRRLSTPVDALTEVTHTALQMRLQRIKRYIQEMCLLEHEVGEAGDFEQVNAYKEEVDLLTQAVKLIEGEVNNRNKILRQF